MPSFYRNPTGGWSWTCSRRIWLVWTTRTDDDYDYDDDGNVLIRSYRVLRLVLWGLTLTAEWER